MVDMLDKKIEIFEYFMFRVLEKFPNREENDLSILKSLKLFFFFATVDCEEDPSFLRQFRFWALPLGHVETEIYELLKDPFKTAFKSMKFDRYKTHVVSNFEVDQMSQSIEVLVDCRMKKLIEFNNDIFYMRAYDLVELSHIWFSWRHYFGEARKEGVYRKEIPNEIIEMEKKIYSF